MKILIRADASISMGTGHIMRCLTLADFLKSKGHLLSFMSDVLLEGNLVDLIQTKGYPVFNPAIEEIPSETDWLIVDHYALDKAWEMQARASVKHIMVIDDLANREHDCDLLLDQNFHQAMEKRYQGKVSESCLLLLGPRYALIRDEFIEARQMLPLRNGKVKRLFVNFGGTDPLNMTGFVLGFLNEIKLPTTIVMGKNALHLDKIQQACANNPYFELHIQSNEMAKLMLQSDLAIVAGGTTTWERACLGLPSIVIAIANNQIALTESLAAIGACFYAGSYSDLELKSTFSKLLEHCISEPHMLKKQGERILELVDGHGKQRVQNALEQF